ncbi:magnesium transporter CorA family protein [Actinoplanes sp. TBRC 11911]|nr:magnesium transporter CorA family protein [Actinoplanes sp. TBRC 11911]
MHSVLVTAPFCATETRLYEHGTVIAEGFASDQSQALLHEHPEAVLWLDLYRPDAADLEAIGSEFRLHPLAIEDAAQPHERPKLDRYAGHAFLNVYAVDITLDNGTSTVTKTEISAFITERALITVRKSPSNTARLTERWDADAKLTDAAGVGFLVYGLLDEVVDGHYAAGMRLDQAMDSVEDTLLEEGGAPRAVRMRGIEIRKIVAQLRRVVAPMPELVGAAMRSDLDLVDDRLRPYYRDVEDHAEHTVDTVEHLRDRIEGLLQADLAEQGNVLNDVTRKLAAWAAIIAVPTAITGYFGQNLPFPGFEKWWGVLLSFGLIVISAGSLYLFAKKRGWL